jgi:hypothetical protein
VRTIIAISSCELYEQTGLNEPLRETWLKDLPEGWDYRFFHGRNSSPHEDVINLDCADEYYALTDKTKLKFKWCLEEGYDFVFSCFPDLYTVPVRLATCGYEAYPYYGTTAHNCPGGRYCQGGPGYFVRADAAKIVADTRESYPNEDCFVGDVLRRHGILPTHDDRFKYLGPGPLKTNDIISNHLSPVPGGYTAEVMWGEHKRWLDSHLTAA